MPYSLFLLLPYDPTIPLIGIKKKKQQLQSRDSNAFTPVFISIVHSSHKLEAKQMFFNGWMDKCDILNIVEYYSVFKRNGFW